MPKAAETYRVFFALWPEAELVAHIDKAMNKPLKDCHGRKILLQNLHITLAFIGSVDTDTLHCMQQAASQLNEESFVLNLDQLGYWSRPKIIWLASTDIPAPLMHLQTSLNLSLAANCGYQPETRAFRPHLSLMRKAQRGPDKVEFSPIKWPINHFSLIRSHTRPEGVEYEVLNNWSLA